MLLTEEEAKTKLCPYTFCKGDGHIVSSTCKASGCMAWRVEYGTWHLGEERFLAEGESFQPDEVVSAATGRGFCGLAGKPE